MEIQVGELLVSKWGKPRVAEGGSKSVVSHVDDERPRSLECSGTAAQLRTNPQCHETRAKLLKGRFELPRPYLERNAVPQAVMNRAPSHF